MQEAAPGFGWLYGTAFIALLLGTGALFLMPSLRRWRTVAWVLLGALITLFGAALVWTFLIDAPRYPN